MKKLQFKESVMMLVAMVFCIIFGTDIGMAAGVPLGNTGTQTATAPNGAEGAGIHNTDEPISLDQSRRDTDFLVLSDLDREVVKILPYKSPLDTMLRYAKKRKTNSIVVEWVSVDSKPFESVTTAAWVLPETPALDNAVNVEITVQNPSVFAKTSTILVPGINGYNEFGVETPKTPLMLYVKKKEGAKLTVLAVNGGVIANVKARYVPSIPLGTELKRMGRAAQEKDVQTESSSVNPTKESNYIQTFKCQVDETYWMKRQDKSVDWNKDDQNDMAVFEWRQEMEATHLAGVKGITYDDSENKGDVYTANGLIRYIGSEYEYASTGWTKDDFVKLTKQAFTGNNGSEKRVLFMNSDLMEEISLIEVQDQRDITKGTEVHWGIEFTSFRTNFGKVLCIHHEQLDRLGIKGVLIDPQNLVKYEFEGENQQSVDNKKTGISNTTSDITTESSCIGLKNPKCHTIISKASAA